MTRPFLVTALVLGAACSAPAGPGASGSLSIVAKDSTLQLDNASNKPVFYFVYERQGAALINWAPCVNQSCPSVSPHGQSTLPYGAIGGYAPGKTEAIVWWWRAVAGPADAPVPGPVSAIVVPL